MHIIEWHTIKFRYASSRQRQQKNNAERKKSTVSIIDYKFSNRLHNCDSTLSPDALQLHTLINLAIYRFQWSNLFQIFFFPDSIRWNRWHRWNGIRDNHSWWYRNWTEDFAYNLPHVIQKIRIRMNTLHMI